MTILLLHKHLSGTVQVFIRTFLSILKKPDLLKKYFLLNTSIFVAYSEGKVEQITSVLYTMHLLVCI